MLGHSQGAADAGALIRDRIDGNPVAGPQLVSALLLGGNVPVPVDRLSGCVAGYSTGYAQFPGLLSGHCVYREFEGGNASWLQVKGGDEVIGGPSSGGVGPHVQDFSLTLGDLGALVAAQSSRWRLTH